MANKSTMPTLSQICGLDKFELTYSQRCDCITLYNHYGKQAAIDQAKKFEAKNAVKSN